MAARQWSRKEIALLYEYASTITMRQAAKKLNRTYGSVSNKCIKLKISWNQGTWNTHSIARIVGCSPNTVKRMIRILFDPCHVLMPHCDKGSGRRYALDEDQAERVISVLIKTRPFRQANIKSGRLSATIRTQSQSGS